MLEKDGADKKARVRVSVRDRVSGRVRLEG